MHRYHEALPQLTVHAVSIDRADTMCKLNVSHDTRLFKI